MCHCFTCLAVISPPLLCSRVRSLIILQEKAQDREKLLLKFIKIMKVKRICSFIIKVSQDKVNWLAFSAFSQHLRKLNNFNSYLAILSALDSAPIRRLEWQKQTSEVSLHHTDPSFRMQAPVVLVNLYDVILRVCVCVRVWRNTAL